MVLTEDITATEQTTSEHTISQRKTTETVIPKNLIFAVTPTKVPLNDVRLLKDYFH